MDFKELCIKQWIHFSSAFVFQVTFGKIHKQTGVEANFQTSRKFNHLVYLSTGFWTFALQQIMHVGITAENRTFWPASFMVFIKGLVE